MLLYNLGFNAILPVGFFINGLFLRKFVATKLYLFGCLAQGLTAALVIFLPSITPINIIFYGLLYGLGNSFFWANKNTLLIKATKADNRLYYSGLEGTMGTVVGIVAPFLAGWLFILMGWVSLPTIYFYYFLSLTSIFILLISGIKINKLNINIKAPAIKFRPIRVAQSWNIWRGIATTWGFFTGVGLVIPTILILMLVGKEGSLGNLQALMAVLSALTTYILSRMATKKHRLAIMIAGIVIFLLGSIFLGIGFTAIGAIVYILLSGLAGPLRTMVFTPVFMELIDNERKISKHLPKLFS